MTEAGLLGAGLRRFGARPPASLVAGALLVAVAAGVALLSFVWTPHPHAALDLAAKLQPPTAAHPFGSDHFGRDVLSMIMVGARNSLAIALAAVALGAGLGTLLGLLAAARPGLAGESVMRANDVVFAFPALLMAVMLAAVLGPGSLNAVLAIGLFNVPVFARVARGAALSLWSREYILAARAAGKSDLLISAQHILPNLLGLLAVQGAIQFALAVVAEAGLSYVGLGTQPPDPSWGRMLAEAQTMIGFAPWLAVFPGLAIAWVVLGLSLVGDGLRDLLDPRSRGPSR